MSFPDRRATVARTTRETNISLSVNLDGTGTADVDTGIGFLDHMLTLFSKHSYTDLQVQCTGDLHIDDHHTVEDIGIVLGQAVAEALGDKQHIERYGHAYVPMDDVLARAVIDLSGRYAFHFGATFSRPTVGTMATEMVPHFFASFAEQVRCNLHLDVLHGTNTHHQIEGLFKACARALRAAVCRHSSNAAIASTKGKL